MIHPCNVCKNYSLQIGWLQNYLLKVFGCIAYVHIPSHLRNKLDPRAEKCVFVGYATNKKGYKCFNPITRKFHITMDVHFVENTIFFHKTSLQRERENEDQFWHISSPTPNISLNDTLFIVGTELFDREKIREPSLPMSKYSELQARGETLQNNNYVFIQEENFIKLLETIQLSWKVNNQPHRFLKVQVYQIPLLILFNPLISMFLSLLGKELELVPNTLLLIFYLTINYLKTIRPLLLKSLICLCQGMFRKLLVI